MRFHYQPHDVRHNMLLEQQLQHVCFHCCPSVTDRDHKLPPAGPGEGLVDAEAAEALQQEAVGLQWVCAFVVCCVCCVCVVCLLCVCCVFVVCALCVCCVLCACDCCVVCVFVCCCCCVVCVCCVCCVGLGVFVCVFVCVRFCVSVFLVGACGAFDFFSS